MEILVLNSGSSSIKFQLFQITESESISLASGLIEQIGELQGHEKIKYISHGEERTIEHNDTIKSHKAGLELVRSMLAESGLVDDFATLDGIGHRVVHGGEAFSSAILIDERYLDAIKLLTPLAPLHNPANITGIEVAQELAPKVAQVAVFDTSYHQTIPKEAYLYAVPYDWYARYNVRRYGFHGTSHFYVAKESAKLLGKKLSETNLITLHLGNGASATAIKNGESVDTSMGLTPLEGLVMGTRSGDIDPAICYFISKKLSIDIKEVDNLLNKKSGLKGICGANDLREIISMAKNGDELARLALEIFCYRIKKYIGSYAVVLGRVDAIVFTGGIGENSALIREMVCEGLHESIGAELDREMNKNGKKCGTISKNGSRIEILVVPTNEELEIALQTVDIINTTKE